MRQCVKTNFSSGSLPQSKDMHVSPAVNAKITLFFRNCVSSCGLAMNCRLCPGWSSASAPTSAPQPDRIPAPTDPESRISGDRAWMDVKWEDFGHSRSTRRQKSWKLATLNVNHGDPCGPTAFTTLVYSFIALLPPSACSSKMPDRTRSE